MSRFELLGPLASLPLLICLRCELVDLISYFFEGYLLSSLSLALSVTFPLPFAQGASTSSLTGFFPKGIVPDPSSLCCLLSASPSTAPSAPCPRKTRLSHAVAIESLWNVSIYFRNVSICVRKCIDLFLRMYRSNFPKQSSRWGVLPTAKNRARFTAAVPCE